MKTLFRTILCLTFALLAFGQDRGTLTGTVADSTGALIPGAKISLVQYWH
jgi:hypothetical protein